MRITHQAISISPSKNVLCRCQHFVYGLVLRLEHCTFDVASKEVCINVVNGHLQNAQRQPCGVMLLSLRLRLVEGIGCPERPVEHCCMSNSI